MPKVEIDVDAGTHKLLLALADLHAHRALRDKHELYAQSLNHGHPPSNLSEDEKRREDGKISERATRDFNTKVIRDGLVVSVRRMHSENGPSGSHEEFPDWHAWERVAHDMAVSDPARWVELRKMEIRANP